MDERLQKLLDQHNQLYGVISRDPTLVDLEVMAQEGYHVVWFDLEHSTISLSKAADLGRFAWHLGMIPMARVVELSRGQVQVMADGGFKIIVLPDVKNAAQASKLVQLGKYPPLGQRGISTTATGNDYRLNRDIQQALNDADAATHLMVQFESDEGYDHCDAILGVDGIDMVTIGPNDWAISAQRFGPARAQIAPKIDHVLACAHNTGKITAIGVTDADQARHYADIGVRILFVGPDVSIRREAYAQRIKMLKN